MEKSVLWLFYAKMEGGCHGWTYNQTPAISALSLTVRELLWNFAMLYVKLGYGFLSTLLFYIRR